MSVKMKIKKGDRVVVISGADKGKTGEVFRVVPDENRVYVRGVNMIRRHQRQSMKQPGGIIEREAALHASNVAHIDPKTQKPTRIGYRMEGDRKVRFARKSQEKID